MTDPTDLTIEPGDVEVTVTVPGDMVDALTAHVDTSTADKYASDPTAGATGRAYYLLAAAVKRTQRPFQASEQGIELIAADLKLALAMFEILDSIATLPSLTEIEIMFRTEGGDAITVGYGESGNPAILAVYAAE